MKKISVIIPAYNEEESLPMLYDRMKKLMENMENYEFEILFVNDGSKDKTINIIKQLRAEDKRICYVDFSRNFGKEIAMIAGLDYATGDCVIFMDADLQDPPELIPELVKYWEEGYDDVYAKRKSRKGETWLKKFTSKMYYKKLVDLAIDGITSFTTSPLRLSTFIAIPTFIVLFVYFVYVIVKCFVVHEAIQAFQAIILLILFFSGIQILLFGIVGEYLGRIFNETKNRPLYLVNEYNDEKEMNEIK